MTLHAEQSQLLLIDMQERLVPAMRQPERVIKKASILAEAAAVIGVPVTISEQYRKGLGATNEVVLAATKKRAVSLEKMAFSCHRDEGLRERLTQLRSEGKRDVVIAGVESHVCVLQTALDLAEHDFGVVVVADATSSRFKRDARLAFRRLREAGVIVVSTEMVVFEWLERAGTAEFKALSKLIK
ncbi:MAG: isochorismatase family protein [Pseudomonadota bacterium]